MALPVAIQVYSVRENAQADLLATLKKIKEMGYDGVEFAGLYGYAPADVKKMCEETGLVPISAHVPYADLVADPEGVLGQYKEIGCRFVAVPYLATEDRPDGGHFDQVIKNIERIGKTAKKLGIQLLYHNHEFEFMTIGGKYALDILYDSVSSEYLQTELDVCWVKVGGENPATYLKKYSGRAPVVHLKDYNGEKGETMYELIGLEDKKPKRPHGFEFRPLGHKHNGCFIV